MKKLLISSIAALGLIGTPAFAADMAVKAPPPAAAPPVYNWTGFYIGGNIGGGWADRDVTLTPNDPAATSIFSTFPPPALPFKTDGVLGGLQVGYNWQFQRNWLLGFETDFDWSGMKGSNSVQTTALTFEGFGPGLWTVDEHLKWFGTVRGRLGWLPWENLLVYGTGGFAYGGVERSGSFANTSAGSLGVGGSPSVTCNSGTTCFAGSSQNTMTGWTVGGGIEYAFWQHWSLKAEYLYVSLENKSLTETALTVPPPGPPASFNANFNHANFNVLRAGLNYRF